MTYPEAIRFLYDLHWFGARPGLETTLKLAELAGNQHERLRFIHVAGTNGKGSTCAILESIYRAAGLRVGLFTSPHLVSFRERIQVNRQYISEADVVRLVEQVRGFLPRLGASQHPTLFEVFTIMALGYFAEQKCNLVIWETGLGGRLDATNIVTPLASVITNVQYDHEKWLGNTLSGIAREKAGIIKPGVPVLTAAAEPEVLEVIVEMARQNRGPLTVVEPSATLESRAGVPPALSSDHTPSDPTRSGLSGSSGAGETPALHWEAGDAGGLPTLPLLGDHQLINAALAKATVEALQGRVAVSEAAIQTGLATVQWPGRMQLVKTAEGRTFLLDCAHNLAGAATLVASLRKHFPQPKLALILGILKDKDWEHMCAALAPVAESIITVPVGSERTASPEELAGACRTVNPQAEISSAATLGDALSRNGDRELTVLTGSAYLIGEALELLGLGPDNAGSERVLNEWGGQPPAGTEY